MGDLGWAKWHCPLTVGTCKPGVGSHAWLPMSVKTGGGAHEVHLRHSTHQNTRELDLRIDSIGDNLCGTAALAHLCIVLEVAMGEPGWTKELL